jgi:hypothetical protein
MDKSYIKNSLKNSGTNAILGFIDTMGRAALNAMSPDDFEYYMCSLELFDSEGATKGFLMFPVMPNSIVETKTEMLSITKTNSGIVSIYNPTFAIRDISIQGTFGRKIRTLSNFMEVVDESSNWFKRVTAPIAKLSNSTSLVKTGYGVMKAMKKMIDTLYKLDENGKPYAMIFSNYALNTRYVVEIPQSSFSQSVGENTIWHYSLEMKAIADANTIHRQTINNSNIIDLAFNVGVSNAIGSILKDTRRLLDIGIMGF